MKFITRLIQKLEGYPKAQHFLQRLADSSIVMRLLSGSFWNAILNVFSKGVSFVGTIIIIRIIGRESFGEFGLLNTTISMFGMFTAFSISQTATKYIAQYKSSDKEKVGKIIGLSFIFSSIVGGLIVALILLFSEYIAVNSLGAPHLKGSLQLMSIGLLFGSLNGVQNGIIYGLEAFKQNTFLGIFLGILLTLVKIVLTYFFGFFGAIVGITLEPLITFLFTFPVVRKLLRRQQLAVSFQGIWKEAKILYTYSLPTTLTGIINLPSQWYVMTLLAKEDNGFFELAGYNAALQWFNVLIFIPYIIMSAFLPVFSELIQEKRYAKVNQVLVNTGMLMMGIFLALSLVFYLFGTQIAGVYGGEFSDVEFLLFLAVFSLLPHSLMLLLTNLTASMDHLWFYFWTQVIWAVVLIGTSTLWLAQGAEGLLYARLLAFSVQFVLFFMYYTWWKSAKAKQQPLS